MEIKTNRTYVCKNEIPGGAFKSGDRGKVRWTQQQGRGIIVGVQQLCEGGRVVTIGGVVFRRCFRPKKSELNRKKSVGNGRQQGLILVPRGEGQ